MFRSPAEGVRLPAGAAAAEAQGDQGRSISPLDPLGTPLPLSEQGRQDSQRESWSATQTADFQIENLKTAPLRPLITPGVGVTTGLGLRRGLGLWRISKSDVRTAQLLGISKGPVPLRPRRGKESPERPRGSVGDPLVFLVPAAQAPPVRRACEYLNCSTIPPSARLAESFVCRADRSIFPQTCGRGSAFRRGLLPQGPKGIRGDPSLP
jgi:hypothetical protein